jgi:LysR family nitrogen assimilation transcriptional regulator
METRQLLYFTRIVALGSFTKAAAELRIAQPALGQQVRHLEEELGAGLLVRHSRGVEPTEAGALLFQHASRILDDVRRAKEAVRALPGSAQGTVTIGMTPGISDLLAAPLVERCNQVCPAVCLNIEQDLSVRLVERIATDDTMTFAIVSGTESDAVPTLITEPLANERLYLVGSPKLSAGVSDPIKFAQLEGLKLVMLGVGPPARRRGLRREVELEAKRQGISIEVAYEMQSVTAVKELIERNFGFGILPFGAVRHRVEEGSMRAIRIVEPKVCREIRLARSARRRLSPADYEVRNHFIALIDEELRKRGSTLRKIPRSVVSVPSDLRDPKGRAQIVA